MNDMGLRALLGPKIAVLASLAGKSQTALAKECGISRISINRFFRGKSEIRASDLTNVLEILGIDLHAEIERRLSTSLKGRAQPDDPIYADITEIIQGLDQNVRRTLFEQILWWGRTAAKNSSSVAALRLQNYMDVRRA